MRGKHFLPIIIFILSFILSGVLFYFHNYLRMARGFGLLGLFLINFVSSASFFVSAPAFLSVIQGGNLYNPMLVALIAGIGSGLGDMVGYIIGRSGHHLAKKKLEKKFWFKVTKGTFQTYGGFLLFAFALVPNPLFDSIGIVAGVFAYSPLRFLIIVAVGRFLRYILLANVGAF